MGFFPFGVNPPLALQAATPVAGYALVNGTGNVITWTTPNDGKLHRFIIASTVSIITATETGGQINVHFTMPDGNTALFDISSGGNGVGFDFSAGRYMVVVKAGTTVTISQDTALTAGGPATMWAEIWGS